MEDSPFKHDYCSVRNSWRTGDHDVDRARNALCRAIRPVYALVRRTNRLQSPGHNVSLQISESWYSPDLDPLADPVEHPSRTGVHEYGSPNRRARSEYLQLNE